MCRSDCSTRSNGDWESSESIGEMEVAESAVHISSCARIRTHDMITHHQKPLDDPSNARHENHVRVISKECFVKKRN